jgi:CheY-like chemotaxis protein
MNRPAMHVLLVDDDPSALDTMGTILEMDGYRVSYARCRRKALEAMEEKGVGAVDLMVVDLEMSGGSGIGLIGEMKRRSHGIPIMVVTELASKQTVVDLMRQGVMDYLDKPVAVSEFRMRVAHMEKFLQRPGRKTRPASDAGAPARPAPPESPRANPAPMQPPGPSALSASTIDTSGSGLPSAFRSCFPAKARGAAALACRKDYGCDLLAAEAGGQDLESFYQSILIKSCFDHHRSTGSDGQSFVRFLNKSLLEGSLGRHAVDLLHARIFLREKRMELIAAGRPHMILLPADGLQPRSLLASGEPLGLSGDVRVEPRVFPVDSGDRLFLFTKAFAADEKCERLHDSIAAHRESPLESMVEKIWNEIRTPSRKRSNHDMFFWGLQIP